MTNEQPDVKPCPYCAETIKAAAIVCRYCNRDLTPLKRHKRAGSSSQDSPTKEGALEQIILEENGVLVTSTRAVMGGKTYAMANITSVSMVDIPADYTPCVFLGVAGAIGAAVGMLVSPLAFGLGLFLIVFAVALSSSMHPTYAVRIGSASGESHALESRDRTGIRRVVDAMTKAIVDRG